MRIIVSDSSCLIDIRKADLLEVFLGLPYEILIPNTLFEDELLKFSPAQKREMIRGGLKVIDLPGSAVARARDILLEVPKLSIHDGFAFALAETNQGCILLTGDAVLRTLAKDSEIDTHGVLWVLDELYDNALVTKKAVRRVLRIFEEDASVRLPKKDLIAYVKRYGGSQRQS